VNIKQIAMIRQPRDRVWCVMRDDLPELARALDDIEAVKTEVRTEDESGVCTIVNAWRARWDLDGLLPAHPSGQTISWCDTARWYAARFETHWEVRPNFLTGQLRCSGKTLYREAMAGQGTRVVFGGMAELLLDPLTGKSVDADSHLVQAIQSAAITLVCKNFRRLLEIADARLRLHG
jgi:hypothetical protein